MTLDFFTLTLDFFTLTLDFLPSPSTFYPHPRHWTLDTRPSTKTQTLLNCYPKVFARINVINILTSCSVTLQCLYSDKRRRKYSSFRTANQQNINCNAYIVCSLKEFTREFEKPVDCLKIPCYSLQVKGIKSVSDSRYSSF